MRRVRRSGWMLGPFALLGVTLIACEGDPERIVSIATIDPEAADLIEAPASVARNEVFTVVVTTEPHFCEEPERVDIGLTRDGLFLVPYHAYQAPPEGNACESSPRIVFDLEIPGFTQPGTKTIHLFGRQRVIDGEVFEVPASPIDEVTREITVE